MISGDRANHPGAVPGKRRSDLALDGLSPGDVISGLLEKVGREPTIGCFKCMCLAP